MQKVILKGKIAPDRSYHFLEIRIVILIIYCFKYVFFLIVKNSGGPQNEHKCTNTKTFQPLDNKHNGNLPFSKSFEYNI